MTKRTFFFTMVNHPAKGWIRAGRAYPTKKIASSWLSFVRGAWRGMPVKVSQCTVYFEQGQICEKSKHILDIKYNLQPNAKIPRSAAIGWIALVGQLLKNSCAER